ncbi:MAG: UbiX family flavin prenyltransferase [Methanosarcinales archaeon]|jgi:flavin prenyltransferase|nr:UbiX family flavin prenyltransferase [Methanosarcinales archaeon]
MKHELVVGISGASGVIYGIRLLEVLRENTDIAVHLVVSGPAQQIIGIETDYSITDVEAMADHLWNEQDFTAPIASGSHKTAGMVVVPCSMKTLAGIANGFSDTLIGRSADICLKEDRRLVLVPRETPLSLIDLENMVKVRLAGAAVLPACPGLYPKPQSVDEMIDFIVGRVLDLLDIEHGLYQRWE